MEESARHTGGTGAAGPAKVMTSSPVSEKKPQRNGHTSPVHQSANQINPAAGKQTEMLTPPSVSEKKPLANGHASPVRYPANSSNSQTANQCVESLLKTDERMRLARERREERERSLAMREQALMEKERRARLQYERTREERCRRLEEQRQKEEQRRAAVEEKRRQQLEEEKERLEALMRKSLERSLQLESRNKRGTWGMNGQIHHGHMTSVDNLMLHRLCTHTHSSLARCSSDAELCVPCPRYTVPSSPHRSLYCVSPSRRRANTVAMELGGANSAPNTPKKERLRTERRTPTGSPVRRTESPADVIWRTASPKLIPKSHNPSPVPLRHHPLSPLRHRPSTPVTDDNKFTVNRPAQEVKGHDPAEKKPLTEVGVGAGRVSGTCKPENHKPADRSTEHSPLTSGRGVARTTDGDKAARVSVERQCLSRAQKEQEEKDRLKAEHLKKKQEEKMKDEEKKRKADEEKELQEKQEVERELMKQQEEQERQQRKKRIEEIMKRTRRSDGEIKREDSQELQSPPSHSYTLSPPGEALVNSKVKGEVKAPPTGAQVKPHTPESIIKRHESAERCSHTPAQVPHSTPSLNSPDRRGATRNEDITPVMLLRSSAGREDQSTQVKSISSSSEKLQEAQVKISAENNEKKLLPVTEREQRTGQVHSTELAQVIKQDQTTGQMNSSPSEQVKTPNSQLVNSPAKNPTTQQVNSQAKSPTTQQVNSQAKSPTTQQVKNPTAQQVKSPAFQQVNSPTNSPTTQQVNSQTKSPIAQQVNSQTKGPTAQQVKGPALQQVNSQTNCTTILQVNSQAKKFASQQVNSQAKSPTAQQMNNPMESATAQQVNSQEKGWTAQQANSQAESPTVQQVNNTTIQQVNSPVKGPTSQQVNSQATCPASHQVNSPAKSPTAQQVNNPTSQQVNSSLKTPASQQVNSTVKSPSSQKVNSSFKTQSLQQVKVSTSEQVNSPVKREQVNGQVNSQAKTIMTSPQVTSKTKSISSPLSSLPPSEFPPPLSDLEYLEKRGGARKESADEVQSMEVSPVSKEELISVPKFSPIAEVQNVVNSTRALEDLLDLTGHVMYPIMPRSTALGDCNKNVIEPKQTSNTLNMRSRKE
ncbi:neurofilament heavy polypeptide-like isoform X2 [Neoarius graeffei]|uniref:neurofilament heavy polypeptide-like isoform X2 n=1 Tax=Neoarius graeffei TaxID=443677 RepID=UPI00298C1903|nr:neurofilament heavy polypeptide-like isoform X2 [Neoarius graeffei]